MSNPNLPPAPHEVQHTGFSGKFIFRDNIPQVFPTATKPVQGRLLPAFDWNFMPNDPAFATGWTPYREIGPHAVKDPKTNLPVFTRWFLELEVFDNLGPEGRDQIISNSSRARMLGSASVTDADKRDAIRDVYNLVAAKAKKDKAYERFIKTEGKTERPLIVRGGTKTFFNVMAVKDGNWVVGAQSTSFTGMQHVKKLLDTFINPMEPQRDPNWSFLYGDVTHPETGLLYHTVQLSEDRRPPFNTLQFSRMSNTCADVQVVPVGADVLAKRINLWDPTLYNWMSYQEQVDYMVSETRYPIEFIEEACGNRASVQARRGPSGGVTMPGYQGTPAGMVGGPPVPAGAVHHSDFIPGIPGDPSYQTPPPPAPVFPPPGWTQHPSSPVHYYKGSEVKTEAELRAMSVPPAPSVPPTPAVPFVPPASQLVPGMLPGTPGSAPAPQGVTGLPVLPLSQAAAPSPQGMPGLPGIPAQAPQGMPDSPVQNPQAAPGLPGVQPVAPVVQAPPVVAAPPPEPVFPPSGWAQHPDSPTHYYKGSEVKTEAELRAMVAPAAPATPAVPVAPAVPSAPPAGGAPMPDGSEISVTPEYAQSVLGDEAGKFFELERKSRDPVNGLNTQEMNEWVALWTRLQS